MSVFLLSNRKEDILKNVGKQYLMMSKRFSFFHEFHNFNFGVNYPFDYSK